MNTEFQELTKAISLIEEMNEYLSFAGGANICTGSIFHQQMMGILDDYYDKRKVVICPDCKGTGKIDPYGDGREFIKCDMCK